VKDNHAEDDAIDETAAVVAAAIRKHVDRAQQRAEAELETLRAQHREATNEKSKLAAQLKQSQVETAKLVAEHGEMQRKLKDAIAAKAIAETHYQELVAASQKLTDGLSRTLHEQREQAVRPANASVPKKTEPLPSSKSEASTSPAATNPPSTKKKPLQFSGPARDAKRVRIRQGTYVSVDGIPGELIDMSLGGAQAVLRQLVKPNQLVRLTIPTAGERLICRGRIVWVVYEQPGTSLSVYRTGVKFTDSDATAVEDFMQNFAEESSPGRRSTGTA
jgi:DNA replication initiation complex subunit (GINS family)